MKHFLAILFLLGVFLPSKAQVSWEKTYQFTEAAAVEELPDHSFIGCGDSIAIGVIFHVDSMGNQISSFTPVVRGETMRIRDLSIDPVGGGLAVTGYSADPSGSDTTVTYLLLNNLMQNTDSLFMSGGGVFQGVSAHTILRTSTNDFILGITAPQGAGSAYSRAEKINYPASHSWTAGGVSHQTQNGIALDSFDNLLMTGYNASTGSGSQLKLFDQNGNIRHNYSVTDTVYNGSLVFESSTAPAPNGNYMYGITLSPYVLSYSIGYLAQLDTAFNLVWLKYLNWGFNTAIAAITPTHDGGLVVLMNTTNGIALFKTDINGDSLWTQFHYRIAGVSGLRIEECADHGFIIVGQRNDGVNYNGYLMKTDSLGRVMPDARITAIGGPAFCEGDQVIITALPGYFYLWSTGETTMSISVDTTGYYWVKVTDSTGLQAQSDTLYLMMLTPVQPVISFQNDTLTSTVAAFYQWYLDGTLINNATTYFYVPPVNGYYQVFITDMNGCTSMSDSFLVTTAGVYENNRPGFNAQLSPNPAGKRSVLALQSLLNGNLVVTLFNSGSQKVATLYSTTRNTSNNLQIPVETSVLIPGIYFIRVLNEDVERVLKLVVN